MESMVTSFQSRYRAASHFRDTRHFRHDIVICEVSISLSSGFSFQEHVCYPHAVRALRFNLVIERLLISGDRGFCGDGHRKKFQSRYRAASHFRRIGLLKHTGEWEFQSRYRAASHFRWRR